MAPSSKKSKKSSSTNGNARTFGTLRTLADIDRDLESLAGVLRHVCKTVDETANTLKLLEAHVEELDLKIIFTMNAVAITRVRHGGIVGVNGEAEKITKKLMEWYREGGRERLLMKLAEAENAIKQARSDAAAAGELDDEGDEAETPEGEGQGTTSTPAKKDPGPTIN